MTLRYLRIQGVSQSSFPGLTGIKFNSGRSLNVENVFIENFSQIGIDFNPTVRSDIQVQDTTVENCGGVGISIGTSASTGGVNRAQLRNTNIFNSGGDGLLIGFNTRAAIYSSVVSRNGLTGTGDGIDANGSNSNLSVDDVLASNNGSNGIHARNAGIVRLSTSTVQDNLGQGTFPEGTGQIFTGVNNRIKNNAGGDGSFSGQIPLT